MPLLAYRITLPQAREDQALGVLWELGTHGVEVQTAEPGQTALLAYLPEGCSIELLKAPLAPLSARIEPVPVPENDWVKHFRQTFRGFTVGRFRVAPPWDIPDRLGRDERLLVIDPGRAFGTGTHETTRLCLAETEAHFSARTPVRVLDIGTGSGILAIAAVRLGAPHVVGVECDPEALVSARRNARLNRVELALVQGDAGAALRPRSFDLVLANLTAPLLRDRASQIAGLVAPSGTLVLSGLLLDEAAPAAAAYAALGSPRERREGEWSALRFTPP